MIRAGHAIGRSYPVCTSHRSFECCAVFIVYSIYEGNMDVPDELKIAIELAERSVSGGGRVATFAREMIRLLKATEHQLVAIPAPATTMRAADGKLVYVVDSRSETLTEFRTSGKASPFRCPKPLYDAMALVLASAERPLAVEEIIVQTAKLLSEPPADHQVRVVLRLWMHVEPALVSRNRTRYAPTDAASFPSSAQSVWEALKEQGQAGKRIIK
jgi:hypothetical protein